MEDKEAEEAEEMLWKEFAVMISEDPETSGVQDTEAEEMFWKEFAITIGEDPAAVMSLMTPAKYSTNTPTQLGSAKTSVEQHSAETSAQQHSTRTLAEQSSTQTAEKQCGAELSGMSQGEMLEEKQSKKMSSKGKQQTMELRDVDAHYSKELHGICELLSQHTKADQDEQVHRQEEIEKLHQIVHGSLQAEKQERSRFEAELHQTTARMDQQMSQVREKLQIVEAGPQARQEDGAGETVTGTAVMAGTGTSVLVPAKETCEEEIRRFSDTVFVHTDAQVERMLHINDDDKWEQCKETKCAKALRKSTLDGRPMQAGSVLFSGEVSEDGELQPLGISLLELVQRVIGAVHRTKLDKLMHRELVRCECEPGSLARKTVDSLTGAKQMREVFRVLYENHPFHDIKFHEGKWKGDLLTIVRSESSKINPGLVAVSINVLGERLEKTPDE